MNGDQSGKRSGTGDDQKRAKREDVKSGGKTRSFPSKPNDVRSSAMGEVKKGEGRERERVQRE